MKGLIAEGKDTIKEEMPAPFGDLALIAAAQRVEHYEISAYGTAKAMANHLGEDEVASLLEATEDEEKAADHKLTEIAMGLMQDAKSRGNGAGGEDDQQVPRKPAAGPKAQAMRAQRK